MLLQQEAEAPCVLAAHLLAFIVCEVGAGELVDLVVACDCVYPDPDGPSPDAAHFVAALAALCAPSNARRRCGPDAASARHGAQHAEHPGGPHGTGACAEPRSAAATPVTQHAQQCSSSGATGGCRKPGGHAEPMSGKEARDSGAAVAVPNSRAAAGGTEAAAEPLSAPAALRCSAGSVGAELDGGGANGCCGRALVTFEARSDNMRAAFLQAARTRFGCVRRLSAEELPMLYRVEHVEVYELASCKHCQA